MKKTLYLLFTILLMLNITIFSFGNVILKPDNTTGSLDTDNTTEKPQAERFFNVPSEVKGTFIEAGKDFYTSSSQSENDVKIQIDEIFENLTKWDFNTIYLSVNTENGLIYPSKILPMQTNFDCLTYFLNKAKEKNIFIYTIINPTYILDDNGYYSHGYLNSKIISQSCEIYKEFISTYSPNAVIIDGYFNPLNSNSVKDYKLYGAGMGMNNWIKENSISFIKSLSDLTAKYQPNTQFGLLCAPSLSSMLAENNIDLDTVSLLSDIQVIVVPLEGSLTDTKLPFKTVINEWNNKATEYGVSLLPILYNSKLGSKEKGWSSPDQILRQMSVVRENSKCSGIVFESYSHLKSNSNSTDLIVKFFKNQIKAQDILTDLTISRPSSLVYSTDEPIVSFYGASDPNFPLQLNGEDVERNDKGVFSLALDLKSGENTFTFTHKDKSITYKITRNIKIISSVAPEGSINVEGGATVPISVYAYENSSVSANIGGTNIILIPSSAEGDTTDKNSNYIKYTGNYTAPQAAESQINVGNISISATWEGTTQSATGAMVRVAALPPTVEVGQTGNMIEVITSQARTYPSNIINADPSGDCFPLAKGSRDYIASDLLTFVSDGKTYNYYILKSGVRISASDVAIIGETEVVNNNITETSLYQEGGFTYLKIKQDLPISVRAYLPSLNFDSNNGITSFSSGALQLNFKDVDNINLDISFSDNNIFSSSNYTKSGNDAVLNLNFKKSGRFAGFKTYYENGYVIFKFTNVPSSLNGAKIYLDPGHGGSDPGSIPIEGMKNEATLNYEMATKVAEILRGRGAQVMITDCSLNYVSLDSRVSLSKNYEPHLFVSLHHNSSTAPSASGTEAWFFNPYSELYADKISSSVAAALGTRDRGEKYGLYRVTTHMEFPAVLVEYGFLSNVSEYDKLKDSAYQNAMALATADAIASAFAQLQ